MVIKKKSSSNKPKQLVGSNTFTNGQPVCKPTIPGRKPKALTGPKHPGFPKPSSSYTKSNSPIKKPTANFEIRVADQNNDLYQRPKTKKKKK